MTATGKKARRDRDSVREQFIAIIRRLPPKQLDQARRIGERIEEHVRQCEAGLNPPEPTFDDILGEGR